MSTDLLLPFSTTPADTIPGIVDGLRETFFTQKTRPLEFRKVQLRKLYWGIKDNEKRLVAALTADLKKPTLESWMSEILWCLKDILIMLENLDTWASDDVAGRELLLGFGKPRVRKDPMGVVLIIGAFNYPVQLTLSPLIGAIAAGNTVLLKPSEISSHSAAVITHIIETSLDKSCYRVVNGAKDETTAILEQKFDKILFTGSGFVGRIVATAAARHLTPCILELGGINPAIVTKKANVKLAAKRIAWGRMTNSGQVCAAPGYVLIHPDVEEEFTKHIKAAWREFFPRGAKTSNDMARMNTARNFHRVKQLLSDTQGQILAGGDSDEKSLFIEPTLVKVHSATDPLLREETFGPILPMLAVKNVDEAIKTIRVVGDTPLAVYIFTDDKEEQTKLLDGTRSGGSTVNDVLMHIAIKTIPFGGVGESGYGAYRGKDSFDAFVHKRSVVWQKSWMEKLLKNRYPPYDDSAIGTLKHMNGSPNFGRDGKVKFNLLSWLFKLGSSSVKGALGRYVLLVLSYYYLFVMRK